jgi:hypothetical protein
MNGGGKGPIPLGSRSTNDMVPVYNKNIHWM